MTYWLKKILLWKKKIEDLTKIICKFTQGKKNFDLILGDQKSIFDKGEIWYKQFLKQKSFKNLFVKVSNTPFSKTACSFCNEDGHIVYNCLTKKRVHFETKKNPLKLTTKDPNLYGYQR